MAETQPGGMKEKEDDNSTAPPAEVSDISYTSIQGGEKTAAKLQQQTELYQESMAPVLPPITEAETPTPFLENLKKARKPRHKKKKFNSNTTEQKLQMQPANINKAPSAALQKLHIHVIQEPSTSNINPSKTIKPLEPTAEQGVPKAISNLDSTTQVLPVIAQEVSTKIFGEYKKTRKPRHKKKKNSSHSSEQALQSSSTHEKKKDHFMAEPVSMNPPENVKPLAPTAKQGVSDAVPSQDSITQVLPVIAEEVSTNILEKPKKQKKPKQKKKKNCSNTTEQEQQIQPANINKESSNADEKIQENIIQEPSTSKIFPPKTVKSSTLSAERGVRDLVPYQYSRAQVLPVIAEETSTDILEKPKKQRKPRHKKNKSTVEQAVQMQQSSAEKIQQNQIQETSTSNVEPLQSNVYDKKAIDVYEVNQESETGQQTRSVLTEKELKEPGQENDIVNNNVTESKTEIFLPTGNVTDEDENSQTSKDSMQQTKESAEGGDLPAVNVYYVPKAAVENDDQKPQTSRNVELGEDVEGNAEAQVQRHLLFFREFYDHSGRLCVRNFDEGKLYIDGLYSQVKLACVNHIMKDKIQDAIHSIMNDITVDFKDFRVPLPNLEILFNRMHNIIFMRLYRVGLTELASVEVCNIIAIYRTHFKRADDIRLLYSLL